MVRFEALLLATLTLLACGQNGDVLSSGGAHSSSSTGQGLGSTVDASSSAANESSASSGVSSVSSNGASTSITSTTAVTAAAASTSSGMTCTPVGPETCATTADDDCDGTECALKASLYLGTVFQASAQTSVGNIYLLGGFSGTLSFAGTTLASDSGHHQFLAKFSATGQELWAKRLPTPSGVDFLLVSGGVADGAIVVSRGGSGIDFGAGPIAGTPLGSVVAAFDSDGNLAWAKPFDAPTAGGATSVAGIGCGPAGDVALIGFADSGSIYDSHEVTDPLSPVPRTTYLFELDGTDGSFIWSNSFYPAEPQYLDHLSPRFNMAGDVIIAGDYASFDVDFGGGPLPFNTTGENGYLARFDSSGTYIESHVLGEGEFGFSNMEVGPNDEIYIAGTSEGGSLGNFGPPGFSGFISKVQSNATVEWADFFPQSDSNNGIGVPEVAAGNNQVMFADPFRKPLSLGFTLLTPKGDFDLAVGKFMADGTPTWGRGFGGVGAKLTPSVIVQKVGRLFVTPTGESTLFFDLTGSVDIGSGTTLSTPATGYGIVIAHLAP